MTKLTAITHKIRSKNAGPFWITIDIFCSDDADFRRALRAVKNDQVAHALGVSVTDLKRYNLTNLRVIKFSFPRPIVQGTRFDRDMHGASFANLIAELDVAPQTVLSDE
jgi:hypothetical protein